VTDDKKVTPINPNMPIDAHRLEDPYSTPSRALGRILEKAGLDSAAPDAGKIEIRVIAEFGQKGCIFHTLTITQVPPEPTNLAKAVNTALEAEIRETAGDIRLDSPAFTVLRMLADRNGKPRSFYLELANVHQLARLDRELTNASMADLETLVAGDFVEAANAAVRLNAVDTVAILGSILRQGRKT
jgi:hypothetical protein